MWRNPVRVYGDEREKRIQECLEDLRRWHIFGHTVDLYKVHRFSQHSQAWDWMMEWPWYAQILEFARSNPYTKTLIPAFIEEYSKRACEYMCNKRSRDELESFFSRWVWGNDRSLNTSMLMRQHVDKKIPGGFQYSRRELQEHTLLFCILNAKYKECPEEVTKAQVFEALKAADSVIGVWMWKREAQLEFWKEASKQL